jgi:hypothetical protein
MRAIFIYTLLVSFFIECNNKRKNDFIIPSSYEGEIAIVFGFPTGKSLSKKEGRTQYFIPDSGIILTNEEFRGGNLNEKFYLKFIDTNQLVGLQEIEEFSFQKDTTKKYIFFDRIATIGCSTSLNKSTGFIVRFFYVGKKMDSTSNSNRFYFEKHIQKLFGCSD